MDTQELMRKRDKKLKKKMKNREEKSEKSEKQEKSTEEDDKLALRRKFSSKVEHPSYDCPSCEDEITKLASKEEE